jgi:hypothetical protein
MPRKPTARPANEHLSTLSRMIGQVDADEKMSGKRRVRVKKYISDLMTEFQKEMTK